MNTKVISVKYAKALCQLLGTEDSSIERYIPSFENILDLFKLPMANKVLTSPVMPKDLKRDLLEYSIKTDSENKTLRNFLNGVVEADRVSLIPEILSEFFEIADKNNGRVTATVTAALPLDEEAVSEVSQKLESIFSKKVTVKTLTNKQLLGGFIAKVGNNVIDLSLKTKLEELTHSQ